MSGLGAEIHSLSFMELTTFCLCCFQVVNSAPLPATIDYRPTISFDDQGKYIGKYHELALSGIQQQETDVMPPNADASTVSTAAIKVTRQVCYWFRLLIVSLPNHAFAQLEDQMLI